MIESMIYGKSEDILEDNINKLKKLFPEIVTENKIDFDKLKLILGEHIEQSPERYNFTWAGKTQAIKESQKQSTGTLRPCKEESKNWDTTQNLYIEGDNLEVLKLLQKTYYNKIKMIYIDPPYNTGRNLIYKNKFEDNLTNYLEFTKQKDDNNKILTTNCETDGKFHSNWLNMMYSRLKLARNLLSEDGCIVIAIDQYELNNLINICNEIFAENNRLGIITVVHKPEGRQHDKFFSQSNEYMIVYAKVKQNVHFNHVVLNDDKLKEFNEEDDLGRFKWKNFIRSDSKRTDKPKGYYPIYVSPDLNEITLTKKRGFYEIFPIKNNIERTWNVLPDKFLKKLKNNEICAKRDEDNIYILYKIREQQVLTTHWIEKKYNATAHGTNVLKKIMGAKVFDFPKSIYLIEDIIKIISNKDSIILDFFSGSATTAHSIMKLNSETNGNRKFIMVQLPEKTDKESDAYKAGYTNICEIGKERIRRSGDQILEKRGTKNLDIGFKVFKLDSSNLEKWDPNYDNLEQTLLTSRNNIKSNRTSIDLVYEIMLKYGIDLTLPIEKHENLYSIGAGALIICLENNITIDIVEDIMEIKGDSEFSRVVFKDNGFKSDSDKTNIKETLKVKDIDEFITI